MKQMMTAAITTLLLCSATAAFAQDASGAAAAPAQNPADMLKSMPAPQRQQMIQSGVDQVQTLTPEQMKQYKAMFDSLPPDQRQQLESEVEQQMQSDPKLKAEAEKKLEGLSPEQKKQLEQ